MIVFAALFSLLAVVPGRLEDLSGVAWALGALTAYCVGVAKTGVPGLGIFVVPLMALAVGDARQSAGWLLPLLCAADVFAVVYYRRHAQTTRLVTLAPWVVLGMAVGAIVLAAPEPPLRLGVGVIVLLMIVVHLVRMSRPVPSDAAAEPTSHVVAYGAAAGFATMVANAAGPIMSLYLLARRLPKEELIGTGAWFFLVINLSKLPVYAWHGLIGRTSLVFDALLLPMVVAGALSGRAIFTRVPQRLFEHVVLALTAVSAALLLWPR
jgi:uncharacterized membrane protein YfcA